MCTISDNQTWWFQSAVAADTHGDGLRARYQQEIEQLRALCEKGLMAMESSHRRIVREMEEKHRAEREQLRFVQYNADLIMKLLIGIRYLLLWKVYYCFRLRYKILFRSVNVVLFLSILFYVTDI